MDRINHLLKNIASVSISIGEIRMFIGDTSPAKWKFCDGSLINRTTYTKLFNKIGTVFGGGDGSTTFALPNLKGRILIGAGESSANGHSMHSIGEMNGEELHTLNGAEMASHQHSSGHGYNNQEWVGSGGFQTIAFEHFPGDGNSPNITSYSGSNSAHNTLQPYMGCNYIIYTGVE